MRVCGSNLIKKITLSLSICFFQNLSWSSATADDAREVPLHRQSYPIVFADDILGSIDVNLIDKPFGVTLLRPADSEGEMSVSREYKKAGTSSSLPIERPRKREEIRYISSSCPTPFNSPTLKRWVEAGGESEAFGHLRLCKKKMVKKSAHTATDTAGQSSQAPRASQVSESACGEREGVLRLPKEHRKKRQDKRLRKAHTHHTGLVPTHDFLTDISKQAHVGDNPRSRAAQTDLLTLAKSPLNGSDSRMRALTLQDSGAFFSACRFVRSDGSRFEDPASRALAKYSKMPFTGVESLTIYGLLSPESLEAYLKLFPNLSELLVPTCRKTNYAQIDVAISPKPQETHADMSPRTCMLKGLAQIAAYIKGQRDASTLCTFALPCTTELTPEDAQGALAEAALESFFFTGTKTYHLDGMMRKMHIFKKR